MAQLWIAPDISGINSAFLHIERQRQMGRARASCGHLAKRGAQQFGYILGPVNDAVPFGQGAEQGGLVQLRQGIASAGADGNIRGDGQDGNGAFVRLDQARRDIGGTAPRRPLADANLARNPGIAIRHIGRRTLVTAENMRHAVIQAMQRIIERQRCVAAETKNIVHAMALQHMHQGLRAAQLVHLHSLGLPG